MKYIVGLDEVGFGAISGHLTICAVKAPVDWTLPCLNDSKKLSPKKRNLARQEILKDPIIQYNIFEASNTSIDTEGLGVCWTKLVQSAITQFQCPDSEIIVDGAVNTIRFNTICPIRSLIQGDGQIPAIMAASILAKTDRDQKMLKLSEQYPMYGWQTNMGYGSKVHFDAIRQHGFSPLHRTSYNYKNL